MYNFGIYHWRRHQRRLAAGVGTFLGALLLWAFSGDGGLRLGAGVIAVAAIIYLGSIGHSLLTPVPWRVDREKYEVLGELVPVDAGDRVLDVGCGTGRSLVGLAPLLARAGQLTALDVFDDRIVLGNTPARARSNAAKAGLDVTAMLGDATRLPLADGTQDVVLVSRLLHDLPEADARRTLAEARRVLQSDGHLGVLELPIVPGDADPATYWQQLLADAGFAVVDARRLPWKDDREYVILAATPEHR